MNTRLISKYGSQTPIFFLNMREFATVCNDYIIKQLIILVDDSPLPTSKPFIRAFNSSTISGPFEAWISSIAAGASELTIAPAK
jgi:hypothetical protein